MKEPKILLESVFSYLPLSQNEMVLLAAQLQELHTIFWKALKAAGGQLTIGVLDIRPEQMQILVYETEDGARITYEAALK